MGDLNTVGHALAYSRETNRFCCGLCFHDLGPVAEGYKLHSKMREERLRSLGQQFESDNLEVASKMVFREFFCPSCGVRFDTEIARAGDPVLLDMVLVASP